MMTKKDIVSLLWGEDDHALFTEAKRVREAHCGDHVFLRGVVEFSSYCRCNCLYCGLRAAHSKERYRLSVDDIIVTGKRGIDLGFDTIVLQGGEDSYYSAADFVRIISELKAYKNIAITLCLGQQSRENLARYREAGADRYLLKMESMNVDHHQYHRAGADYHARLGVLKTLQDLGYETGSGTIVGLPALPGQDGLELLADDLLALTALKLDMIAIGPFLPHHATPLAESPAGDLLTSHRALALARILNPDANIPATTALDALGKKLACTYSQRAQALAHGANVLMEAIPLNMISSQKGYDIYPEKGRKQNPYQYAQETIAEGRRLRAENVFPKA